MSRRWATAVVVASAAVMIGIPVGAIVVAGAASARPVIEPLRPLLSPMLGGMLLLTGLAAVVVLVYRAVGPERIAAWRKRYSSSRWAPIGGQIAFFTVFFVGGTLVFGIWFILDHAWMVVAVLGANIALASRRRIGDEIFCARCGYEQTGESVAPDEREDRCPECGAFWRRRGGTVKGRRHISRIPLVAGIGVCIAALGWMIASVSFPQLRAAELSLVPSRVLIDSVATSRSFTRNQMRVLSQRTLTRDQDLRLIRGLLDKRAQGEGLFGEERMWMETAFVNGRLPPELLERFFAEEVEIRLLAPEGMRVGQGASLALYVHHRGMNFGRVHDLYIAFGGYFIDDDPQAHQRREAPIHASRLGRFRPSFRVDQGPSSPEANPEFTIRAEYPGTMRVRAELWIFAVPYRTPATAHWNADGTPALPPNTMWHKPLVLTREVGVKP